MHATRTLLVSILAAAGLSAQAATYRLFGEGCNGTPITNAITQNDVSPVLTVASLPNEYAYPVINTTGVAIQIVGFETFTVTNGALTATGNTGILFDNAGPAATVHSQPAMTNAANGKVTVSNVQGWYSTAVYPPITIGPGVAFWLHQDAYSQIAPPQHAVGGVAGPTVPWWRRPNYIAYAWSASGSVARPIFRIHAVAATPQVPSLLHTGTPQLGGAITFQIAGGQAMLPAFLCWGVSDQQWLTLPTPVDLALFGAPNCFVRQSSDSADFLLLDANGAASIPISVPNVPSLSGLPFFNQAAALVPGANALNLLVTNAGAGVVGT